MASGGSGSLKGVFDQYSRFGKTEAQLKDKEVRLESRNIQKMMKDCGVIDSKYTTQALDNDVARVLGQLTNGGTYPKGTKTFELKGFKQLVDQIADSKKTSSDQICSQLCGSDGPSLVGVTGTANASNVARMTDTSQYTGSHKERFDASGQGKGKDGRVDQVENSGYVGNYKGAGTYDKKH